MKKWIAIFVTALLAAFLWDFGGPSSVFASEEELCAVSEENTDFIVSSDNSSDCYTDWNEMAYSADDTSVSLARCPVVAYRIRVSGNSSSSHSADNSSFPKCGKVVSLKRALAFACFNGLFPTGRYSFSQHLISLRKMRI